MKSVRSQCVLATLLLVAAGCSQVREPQSAAGAFDLPRAVNATSGDTTASALQLKMMLPVQGPIDANHWSPAFSLSWNDEGLLVVVEAADTTPHEADRDNELYAGDSVELFVSRDDRFSEAYQLTISPGTDPDHAEVRTVLVRDGVTPPEGEVEADVSRAFLSGGGYRLRVLLPWKNLNLTGARGEKVRLQVVVNDANPAGGVYKMSWFPSALTYRRPQDAYTLVLGKKAAKSFALTALADYPGFSRAHVTVAGAGHLAGRTVEIFQGDDRLGSVVLTRRDLLATGELDLLMPSYGQSYQHLSLRMDGEEAGRVTLSRPGGPTGQGRDYAARRERFVFDRYIFSGTSLPTGSFENPSKLANIVGPYSTTVRYFDADFNEVSEAREIGRYGAVVEIKANHGSVWRRYITLFRSNSGDLRLDKLATPAEWAGEIGVALTPEQQELIEKQLSRSPDQAPLATLLAVVAESARSGEQSGFSQNVWASNSVRSREASWWFRLKQTIGEENYLVLTQLPAGFGKQPGKRYPLIVYLHGSVQEPDLVKSNDVFRALRHHPEFECIAVAPLCPRTETFCAEAVDALLDEIIAKYPIDEDRIYLTGFSMGGCVSWTMAKMNPKRFAALAPVSYSTDLADMEQLLDLPVWAFIGAKDGLAVEAITAAKGLREMGGRVRLTIYPEAGHDTPALSDPRLYEWLLQQKRGAPAEPRGGTGGAATMPAKQP